MDSRHGPGAAYWPNGKMKSRGTYCNNILRMNVPYLAVSETGSLLVKAQESLVPPKKRGWFARAVGKLFGCSSSSA